MFLFEEESDEYFPSITFTNIRCTVEINRDYILKIGVIKEKCGVVVVLKHMGWNGEEILFTKLEFLQIIETLKSHLNNGRLLPLINIILEDKRILLDYFGEGYSLDFYSSYTRIYMFEDAVEAFCLIFDSIHRIITSIKLAEAA